MESTVAAPQTALWVKRIVWYLVGAVEIVLLFRFILKLFGANSTGGFAHYTYMITDPLTIAFTSIFNVSQLDASMFEWTTLLAMAVYALIGWGITALIVPQTDAEAIRANRKIISS